MAAFVAGLAIWPAAARAAEPAASQSVAPSQSLSEMLEQGIYNQDTKGDIDTAIGIYRNLIAQSKANDSLAAQAEFRLGQCYLKKNQKDAATAIFQKLITDFPNETDLVAKAKENLPGAPALGPIPWVDGERLLMKMSLPNGADLGVVEYRANFDPSVPAWNVGARMDSAQASSVSNVTVEPDTFRSISSTWKHSMFGTVKATYHPGSVDLLREGQTGTTTIKTDGPVIDNEEAMDLIRRLPLADGYKTSATVFSTLGGGCVPIGLEVKGIENVTVPAGNFQCFKIALSVGQNFWYSTDAHRYLVQFEAGPIMAKLDSITQRGVNDPVDFHDADLGVSLTAPPQWVVARLTGGQPAGESLIRTFDPNADETDGGVRYFTTSSLSADEQKSSKAWAESNFKKDGPTFGNDMKVRPDSWKEQTVSGRPAESYVADFTVSGKPRTMFSLYVLGPKDSEHFVLISPTDKFDALMTQFDTIIATYHRS